MTDQNETTAEAERIELPGALEPFRTEFEQLLGFVEEVGKSPERWVKMNPRLVSGTARLIAKGVRENIASALVRPAPSAGQPISGDRAFEEALDQHAAAERMLAESFLAGASEARLKEISEALDAARSAVLTLYATRPALISSDVVAASDVAEYRDPWIDWRGSVEGFKESLEAAKKAVAGSTAEPAKVARYVLWVVALDHVWEHVAALRSELARKQVPAVADALRSEADRLHAKADALIAQSRSSDGGAK